MAKGNMYEKGTEILNFSLQPIAFSLLSACCGDAGAGLKTKCHNARLDNHIKGTSGACRKFSGMLWQRNQIQTMEVPYESIRSI
jgi:hypothetical protein